MTNFVLLFINLILEIKNNNLEETKTIVEELNKYLASIEIPDYSNSITEEDLYSLELIAPNESFDYFISEFKPKDIYAKRALLNLQFKNFRKKFEEEKISVDDYNNFILNHCTNTDADLSDYEYLLGIRSALSLNNYDTIRILKDKYIKEM
jgi:hypothetical protein